MSQPKLTIIPCSRKEANRFVAFHHRHHKPVVSGKFCIAVVDETGTVRGVAMIGNPVARPLMDGRTVEVNRVATDGCPNACSALYGAAWRIAREMGYLRMITYILESEPGISLRASGWREDGTTVGRSWHQPRRPRALESHPTVNKTRWVIKDRSTKKYRGEVVWPTLEDEGNPVSEMFGIDQEGEE